MGKHQHLTLDRSGVIDYVALIVQSDAKAYGAREQIVVGSLGFNFFLNLVKELLGLQRG